jgi:alkaline phosphatase D
VRNGRVAWLILLVLAAPSGAVEPLGPLATGVSESGVTLWARGPGEFMEAELERDGGMDRALAASSAKTDHTASVRFDGLAPGTRYTYRVRFAGEPSPRTGHFRTAPAPGAPAPLRIAFGGDVAGQNVCRDRERGFPIFAAIRDFAPDLFLALGDMIYADAVCEATGLHGNAQVPGGFPVAVTLEDFRAHWRYVRADPALASLLASAASTPVWDDHEVVNDFGPRQGGELLDRGRRAYLEYNPAPGPGDATRLHRSERWGRHVELFVLDTRSHRDPNAAPDADSQPLKSMLGAEQERWLRRGLVGSDATWKLVVSSVPLAIPTGSNAQQMGRDGWAGFDTETGFERSLLALLEVLRTAGVRNLLWLTTDVHFASVQRFQPFAKTPDFIFHEVVTGPLQAGLFPQRRLDPTLNPKRLFYHGPEPAQAPESFEEALNWFNFGTLEVNAVGRLAIAVRGVDGSALYELVLDPL